MEAMKRRKGGAVGARLPSRRYFPALLPGVTSPSRSRSHHRTGTPRCRRSARRSCTARPGQRRIRMRRSDTDSRSDSAFPSTFSLCETGFIARSHKYDAGPAASLHAHDIRLADGDGGCTADVVPDETSSTENSVIPEVTEILVANHREFLRFVDRRVGNRAIAEEIVQDAFVRSLGRGDEIRDSVVGWFYRVLRNAVIDHQRRQTVADRRLDQFAAELETSGDSGEELAQIACRCVLKLADTLKQEYADALRRIEIDQIAVKDYAQANGISASNAGCGSSARARRCGNRWPVRAGPALSTAASTAPASPPPSIASPNDGGWPWLSSNRA